MTEIVGKKYVTPFSRGILAGSLMKAGLDVEKSYKMAEDIQKRMEDSSISRITEEDLTAMAYEMLLDSGYTDVASYYRTWHSLREEKRSVIILLGGATGVGKSTIASEIGYRLGIHSIIGTDTVREVMRKMVSKELLPTLHSSSFTAWEAVQAPSTYLSSVIYAFELQTSHVSVGVNAVIQRALEEGLSLVLEGIHLVPGHIQPLGETVFHFVLKLEDREEHIRRIYRRAKDTRRPPDQYIQEIDKIRQVQDYIVEQAHIHEVSILENKTVEETINQILNTIYEKLQKEVEI